MRKNLIKLGAMVLGAGNSLYWALPVLAANDSLNVNLCTGEKASILCNLRIPNIIQGSIQLVLVVAFILAFAYLVMGGIKWITSGGDKDQTKAAKETITAALIGLVVIFAAWAIISFLTTFFGVGDLTQLNVPPITK